MSKEKSTDLIIAHKNKAIEILNNFLDKLTITNPKKADLISYWLHSFSNYILFEDSFDPKKNKRYERGDIIKVDFGFNIGSEYGGLHYAVILDIKNDHSSPIVTVVPLSSTDDKTISSYNIDLGDELYQKLRSKALGIKQSYKAEREELQSFISSMERIIENIEDNNISLSRDDYTNLLSTINIYKEKINTSDKKQKELSKLLKELNQMKHGSMALVSQIRCISKIRIIDPRQTHGVLNGIKLSSENMDKIDNKLHELFIKR